MVMPELDWLGSFLPLWDLNQHIISDHSDPTYWMPRSIFSPSHIMWLVDSLSKIDILKWYVKYNEKNSIHTNAEP